MLRNIFPRAIRHDTNLLITLYLLLRIKHVSSVANVLCISQSAVSQQLARLRDVFGDPLLIRNQSKMILTPYAEELFPNLDKLLAKIEDIYNTIDSHDVIRPTKEIYKTCIYGDFYHQKVAQALISIVKETELEQYVSFEIFSRNAHSIDSLKNAKIDFFIGSLVSGITGVMSTKIKDHSYSFAVNKRHPLANKIILGEQLCNYDYIEPPYFEEMKECIKESYGDILQRVNVALRISSCHSVIELIESYDMITILPDEKISEYDLAKVEIKGKKLSIQNNLYWHELMNNDSFHTFVRKKLPNILS